MTERCPLVNSEYPAYDLGFVFDAGIPEECWACFNTAYESTSVPKSVKPTNLNAEDFPGLDFVNAERNINRAIRRNGGIERSGLVEQTIDTDGSQDENLESIVSFEFLCQKMN